MKKNYGLSLEIVSNSDDQKLVKIKNTNPFRICNLKLKLEYASGEKLIHINSIDAQSVWVLGQEAKGYSPFTAVGYAEGRKREISTSFYDENTGIYHGSSPHCLVWKQNDSEDKWKKHLVWKFPADGAQASLDFIAKGPRVAFVGHSFTGLWDSSYYYFRELAKSGGWNAQIAYSYWGGKGIAHYAGLVGDSEDCAQQCDRVLCANDYYDFCVFAGNSDEAVSTNSGRVGAVDYSQRGRMKEGGRILYKKARNKDAKVLLWVPQAYRYGFLQDMCTKPWKEGKPGDIYERNGEKYVLTLSQAEMTASNIQWYKELANELGKYCSVIPVAEVYQSLINSNGDEIDPYIELGQEFGDFGHQNNLGNYIGACTCYAHIFKESPEGLGIPESHTWGMAGGRVLPHQAELIAKAAFQSCDKINTKLFFGG